jgi:transcriptional regulator with XRE-family HTH domain
MSDKQNIFGQELRRLRKEVKLRQIQLAKLAGISAAYISQLETGKKKPTDRVMAKLCGALDIPENRLLIKIGKIKMDLAATLAVRRKEMPKMLTSLSDDQLEELLTYLAYIKVKASIIDKA